MTAFDTNIVVHACNTRSPFQAAAAAFLENLGPRDDVVVCELMLLEVYLKIRNPAILTNPYPAQEAATYCRALRTNPRWMLVESARLWIRFGGSPAREISLFDASLTPGWL